MNCDGHLDQAGHGAASLAQEACSYPRLNGLAVACVAGTHERTAVHPGLAAKRRLAVCGLNKGQAPRAGPRRVLQPPGKSARSFQQQATGQGLNLVTAAIVLWVTVCVERAARLAWPGKPSTTVVAVPVAAGLGAHQPDRRLPLAQQRQDRRGQVQAARPLQPA
jgi:hypothetical protein